MRVTRVDGIAAPVVASEEPPGAQLDEPSGWTESQLRSSLPRSPISNVSRLPAVDDIETIGASTCRSRDPRGPARCGRVSADAWPP